MYADLYARQTGLKPGSFALALALNGAIITSLALFTSPAFRAEVETRLKTYSVPSPTPPDHKTIPPRADPKPEHDRRTPAADKTTAVVERPSFDPVRIDPLPSLDPGAGTGTGGAAVKIDNPPKSVPVITEAGIDRRYLAAFQPIYPPDERRAEHDGRVVVRVLIGVDGRVRAVERVSATSDSFFESTRRRALEKWRFTPATQDGIPIEAWRTMTVRFVLAEAEA